MINIPDNVLLFIKSEKFDSCELLDDRQKLVVRKIILQNFTFANVGFLIHTTGQQVINILKKTILFLENFLREKKPNMLLSQTTFSTRIKNCLNKYTNFRYLSDLNNLHVTKLQSFGNIGQVSIDEIQFYLQDLGMSLNFENHPPKDQVVELKGELKNLSNIELLKIISFCSDLLKSRMIDEIINIDN